MFSNMAVLFCISWEFLSVFSSFRHSNKWVLSHGFNLHFSNDCWCWTPFHMLICPLCTVDPWTVRGLEQTLCTVQKPRIAYSQSSISTAPPHLRFHTCGFSQPWIVWYCSTYDWKKSMFKWDHAVQTHVVQGSAVSWVKRIPIFCPFFKNCIVWAFSYWVLRVLYIFWIHVSHQIRDLQIFSPSLWLVCHSLNRFN